MSGPRLSVIPAGALDDVIAGLLRDGDLRVLNALGTFTDRNGWTRPTRQVRFAERCGFGRQRVNDAITALEWLGWIEVQRAERNDRPSRYRVRLDPGEDREPGTPPAEDLTVFRRKRREAHFAAQAAEHAAQAAGAVEAEVGLDQTGPGGARQDGEAARAVRPDAPKSKPDPCRQMATPPCRRHGDTPCRHCNDNRNDSSFRFSPPSPPQAADDPAELERWRDMRRELRARVGEWAWRAWAARLRLAPGLAVMASDEDAAMDVHREGAADLRAVGVTAIIAEETGWRMEL